MNEEDAALYEAPYAYVLLAVKPLRAQNNREVHRKFWWRHAEARPGMRVALAPLPRYIATPALTKHRSFVWLNSAVLPDQQLLAFSRADDTTFGILHSRFHELWSLRMCTWLGVGNDPRYTPTTCFETFPFPAGLTPADTAHQQTEVVEGGALIPATVQAQGKAGADRTMGAILKSRRSAAYERPASGLPPPGQSEAASAIAGQVNSSQGQGEASTLRQAQDGPSSARTVGTSDVRQLATQIAIAAKRLNDLREAWLNPPEWTRRVPEVVPLGMATSPYPDRIEPKAGLSEADLKALQKRTLTNLYNLRPAWLNAAQEALDAAVAVAYGWADYTPAMTDDEILQRLLALNLARAEPQPVSKTSFDLATKRRERVLQGRDAMGSGAEAMARAKARLK